MSAPKKISEKLKELPHMNEDHQAALERRGITTEEKLLEILKDGTKWKEIHPEMKGIGPKTVEKWIDILEADMDTREAEREERLERDRDIPKKLTEKKAVRTVKKKPEAEAEEKPKPKVEITERKLKAAPEAEEEKKKPSATEEEEEEEAEGVEIVDEGEYVPKKKPKLSERVADAMSKRKSIASNRPEFRRQEFGRYIRVQTGWRKPRGMHSKARKKKSYRRPNVSIGYRGPKMARGLHSSGFEEVRVFNTSDLEKVKDADRQAVRIGHSVGQRKRETIIERADELGIRVLNRS